MSTGRNESVCLFLSRAGKSSLVKQFIEVGRTRSCYGIQLSASLQNHFVDSYYPTIESTFTKSMVYKDVEYDCHIIDTAGQVRDLPHRAAPPLTSAMRGVHRTNTRR